MDFLHYELQISNSEIIEVSLDEQANVRLLDDSNYRKFKHGQRHRFQGGRAKRSPILMRPPHSGRWHLVIDLGGFQGRVTASVRTIKN